MRIHIVMPMLLALMTAACASQTDRASSPVDYLLVRATPLEGERADEVFFQAHLVDTDDPEIHALLTETDTVDWSVLTTLQKSSRTRIVAMPQTLARADQDASVVVGESVRFAHTVAERQADGSMRFRIDEHPRSPQFSGYSLFLTPASPTPGEPIDVRLRFEETAVGNVIAHVPASRLALVPAQTRVVAVRRP